MQDLYGWKFHTKTEKLCVRDHHPSKQDKKYFTVPAINEGQQKKQE